MDLNYHQQHRANEGPRQAIISLCMLCVALLFLASCANPPSEKSGTVPQNKQTQQEATAIVSATVDATDSPTPDPSSTPDVNATKYAKMTPPVSEQQTVQVGQTNIALGTPYPTLDLSRPKGGYVSLGISGCADAGAPGAYNILNCWTGTPTVGEYLNVLAGAPKSDPEQGVLRVYTETASTDETGPDLIYETPTKSGPVAIANVNWPHMTLITSHPENDRIPVVSYFFNLQTRTWEEPSTCQLFPIALSADLLQGVIDQYSLYDANYGIESRDFGWLTWDGDTLTDTLAVSLSPPGNSSSYTNPDDPDDHTVSVGDWVLGRPQVEDDNSPNVERAMSVLAIRDQTDSITSSYAGITVPLWDQAVTQGSVIRYHVSGFVWLAISHYSLAQPNLVSLDYRGHTTCPNAP
jgi:hypothetical protein